MKDSVIQTKFKELSTDILLCGKVTKLSSLDSLPSDPNEPVKQGHAATPVTDSTAPQHIIVQTQVHRSNLTSDPPGVESVMLLEQGETILQQSQICLSPEGKGYVEECGDSPLPLTPRTYSGSLEKNCSPISLVQPRLLLSPILLELRAVSYWRKNLICGQDLQKEYYKQSHLYDA